MREHFVFLRIVLVSLVVAPAWGSVEDVLAKISLEQTVCDLDQVGLGTKNSCEFKFTNTGQGPLKITNVKSTCGCTVAQLDKKEYTPGESGTIKVTYTAPNTTTTTQKSIYVSSNDKANPNVRLTIEARVWRGCPWSAEHGLEARATMPVPRNKAPPTGGGANQGSWANLALDGG